MKHALAIFVGAVATLHGTAAYAQNAIILPNGVTVPYYGQAAPTFRKSLDGKYYSATDPATGSQYFYGAGGRWIGTQGSNGQPLTGLPTMPNPRTTVTLPNGMTVPYTGVGNPKVTTHADGYSVFDPFRQSYRGYDLQGNPQISSSSTSGGAMGSATVVNGSSSFGSTYLPSSVAGGVSSSFGSSGIASSGSGGTSISASGDVKPSVDGGGTDVPAPGMVVLFGLGAAAVIAARSRREKD